MILILKLAACQRIANFHSPKSFCGWHLTRVVHYFHWWFRVPQTTSYQLPSTTKPLRQGLDVGVQQLGVELKAPISQVVSVLYSAKCSMLSENGLNFLGKSPRLRSFHMGNFCWSSLLVFEFALHLLWSQNPIALAGQGWPFRRWACSMEARQFFLVWSVCGSMLDIPFFLAKFVESLGDPGGTYKFNFEVCQGECGAVLRILIERRCERIVTGGYRC